MTTDHHARYLPADMYYHLLADLLLVGQAVAALEMQAELTQERPATAWDVHLAGGPVLVAPIVLS